MRASCSAAGHQPAAGSRIFAFARESAGPSEPSGMPADFAVASRLEMVQPHQQPLTLVEAAEEQFDLLPVDAACRRG
jgi:hypothetical protein